MEYMVITEDVTYFESFDEAKDYAITMSGRLFQKDPEIEGLYTEIVI